MAINPILHYSLVESETTGKVFLDERHPSRSIWSELDFIARSSSSLALLRRRSWLAASASFNWKREIKKINNQKCCNSIICQNYVYVEKSGTNLFIFFSICFLKFGWQRHDGERFPRRKTALSVNMEGVWLNTQVML